MPQQRDVPYIWVTWLTKLLVGRDSCVWSAWFRSNYQYFDKMPSDFDSVSWSVKHTNLLDKTDESYRGRYPDVRRENQNSFMFRGRSGAIVAGKPDLIGINDQELRICDVKTGQQADEHWAQMLLYMHFYSRVFPNIVGDRAVVGELVYPDAKQEVYMEEFDEPFRTRLTTVLQSIASNTGPIKVPSDTECGYCCITATDCPERIIERADTQQIEFGDF